MVASTVGISSAYVGDAPSVAPGCTINSAAVLCCVQLSFVVFC